MPQLHPVVFDEVVTKQVAALALTGASRRDIASQLGIGDSQVRRIMDSEKFKEIMKEVGDEAVTKAKQAVRAETSKLAKEVIRVLTEQLSENNLEAVKIALKVLGLDQVEEKQTGDTNISVVLPGASNQASPRTKDIEAEYVSTDVPEGGEGSTQ